MTGPLCEPEDVLTFWFDTLSPRDWFSGDKALDGRIRQRFAALCHGLRARLSVDDHPWLTDSSGCLALVLACDQFPRHIWRGSNVAYALDPKAREVAHSMLDLGYDLELATDRRGFVYMPLMHSEDLEDQALCVALCQERLGEADATTRHARLHYDVIAKFGRFPHRNAALHRASTPQEAAFLEAGGYSPGVKRPAKKSTG